MPSVGWGGVVVAERSGQGLRLRVGGALRGAGLMLSGSERDVVSLFCDTCSTVGRMEFLRELGGGLVSRRMLGVGRR